MGSSSRGGTRADFRIVEGSNPVYGTWDPNLAIGGDYAVVDVQLIQGGLLQDRLFITDFSQPSPRKKHHFQYCTLADRLDEAEIAKIRQFIKELLIALAAPERDFVWFDSGDFAQDGEEYYCIDALCDNLWINGRLAIFEVMRDDVAWYSGKFCAGDLIRGVAIEAGRIKEVLARLSLAEPIPTTQRYSCFRMIQGADNPKSLQNILEIATFFFEEIDNGARLRLVSRAIPREQIIATVARVIECADNKKGS